MKYYLVSFCCFLMVSVSGAMSLSGAYPNGVEGLKGASVPPPGLYFKNYFIHYEANRFMDNDGNNDHSGLELDANVYAGRLIWITDKKFLGADYGCHILVPYQNVDFAINAVGLADRETGIGDVDLGLAILSWHLPHWDLVLGYDIFLPTGEYDDAIHFANLSNDAVTHMFTAGATYNFGKDNSWSASILARYEIHHKRRHDTMFGQRITQGDDFHFEWGVSKNFNHTLDIGIAGYCQWQLSEDRGDDFDLFERDRVFAVGPEINYFYPPFKTFFSFRMLWEFAAENNTEGVQAVLTVTKIF